MLDVQCSMAKVSDGLAKDDSRENKNHEYGHRSTANAVDDAQVSDEESCQCNQGQDNNRQSVQKLVGLLFHREFQNVQHCIADANEGYDTAKRKFVGNRFHIGARHHIYAINYRLPMG